MVKPRQQRRDAADVGALLADAVRRTHQHVRGLPEVDAGVALDQGPDRDRGQLVGPHPAQRALSRAPDRRADRVDDHSFGHHSLRVGQWSLEAEASDAALARLYGDDSISGATAATEAARDDVRRVVVGVLDELGVEDPLARDARRRLAAALY